MRVYISGRMTGCPNLNRAAFDAAEKRLIAQGHFVINPHRISALFGSAEEIEASFKMLYAPYVKTIEQAAECLALSRKNKLKDETSLALAVLDADLAAVRSCDAIYLLRGWENSRGAKKELAEALAHGLKIIQEGAVK